jgi:hypothetical protein
MLTSTEIRQNRISSYFTPCYLILIQSMLRQGKDVRGSLLKEYSNLVNFVSFYCTFWCMILKLCLKFFFSPPQTGTTSVQSLQSVSQFLVM